MLRCHTPVSPGCRFLAAVAAMTLLLAGRGLAQDNAADQGLSEDYQQRGVRDLLPVFRESAAGRLSFPYSWQQWRNRNGDDFDAWRKDARQRVHGRLGWRPRPE